MHSSVASGASRGRPTGPQAALDPSARIGPNAVIQTLRALRELESPEVEQRVSALAGLPESWPEGMIPEAWFVRLVKSLRKSLPAPRSAAVLRRSGMYTAHYVGTHRIPALFRGLLKILPARLSIPLLLAAFRRHAFTFAGSGQFHTKGPFPGVIVLSGCPTCRPEAGEATGPPSGAYYEAAFEGLLHLCTPQVRVREVACQSRHAAHCRFQISIDREAPNGLEGESACAFS